MSDRAGQRGAHRGGVHFDGEVSEADLPAKIAHVRDNFWGKLKRVLARVPFAEDLVAAYYCMMDPATPAKPKALIASALAYFILPIDAVPDFILGLGLTDDAAVLAAVIAMVRSHITDRHRQAAKTALEAAHRSDPKS